MHDPNNPAHPNSGDNERDHPDVRVFVEDLADDPRMVTKHLPDPGRPDDPAGQTASEWAAERGMFAYEESRIAIVGRKVGTSTDLQILRALVLTGSGGQQGIFGLGTIRRQIDIPGSARSQVERAEVVIDLTAPEGRPMPQGVFFPGSAASVEDPHDPSRRFQVTLETNGWGAVTDRSSSDGITVIWPWAEEQMVIDHKLDEWRAVGAAAGLSGRLASREALDRHQQHNAFGDNPASWRLDAVAFDRILEVARRRADNPAY